MNAGHEHGFYMIKLSDSDCGAQSIRQQRGYYFVGYDKYSSQRLFTKKRRIFLPENKNCPQYAEWMRMLK